MRRVTNDLLLDGFPASLAPKHNFYVRWPNNTGDSKKEKKMREQRRLKIEQAKQNKKQSKLASTQVTEEEQKQTKQTTITPSSGSKKKTNNKKKNSLGPQVRGTSNKDERRDLFSIAHKAHSTDAIRNSRN